MSFLVQNPPGAFPVKSQSPFSPLKHLTESGPYYLSHLTSCGLTLLILFGHTSLVSIHLISQAPSTLSLLPGPLVPQKSMCLPHSFSRPGLYFIQKEHVAFFLKKKKKIEVKLINNVVLVSGVWQNNFFPPDSFPL